ncbi:unnamed protein product [Clavelina lepadiformis]|uniref:RNA helicase n=1 Tax=Clavelina lepadiformis TaxID=159417 RepID=A0ABP0FSD9_CLALP
MVSLISNLLYSVDSFIFGNAVRITKEDQDFQSFLNWFNGLEVEADDDFCCVASCKPDASVQSITKRRDLYGKVTSIFDDHGLIDHYIYFTMKDILGFGNNNCPSVGDAVHVQAEQTRAGGGWKATCVTLLKEEKEWDDSNSEFRIATVHEKRGTMIGKITSLDFDEKKGTIEDVVTFSFNSVMKNFKPYVGDWVQADVAEGSVANDIHPLRSKQMTGTVTFAPRKDRNNLGFINDDIFFDQESCFDKYCSRKGDQVVLTAIESKQGKKTWRATEVKFLSKGPPIDNKNFASRKSGWALRGKRPQSETNSALPSFLPQFALPESLRTCVCSGGDILKLYPCLNETLTPRNYAARFSVLLHLEELATEAEIESFQMTNVTLLHRGEFLVLNVPGVLDGKPSLCVGDIVICRGIEDNCGPEYHGFIHHIVLETEELLLKFHERLHADLEDSDRFNAFFTYSRTPFRRCHLAINVAKQKFVQYILFSNDHSENNKKQTETNRIRKSKEVEFFNDCLNERQMRAVERILTGEGMPRPYVLFGPPGTGKTVTLVEAIIQIIIRKPSSRILVCAPSNSAVDLLCERLHATGKVTTQSMVRFNAFRRPPQAVPETVRRYCHPEEALLITSKYQIVLTTCVNAGNFYTLLLRSDHFSHVCIDEAGQASEPETLIPIGLAYKGQIILTGDPEQLGAVLKSPFALYYGLNVSLLERLMRSEDYSRDKSAFSEGYNPVLVTKLVNNYRSHPAILSLPSMMFYDNELQPCADEEIVSSLCLWEHLPKKQFPIIFHGIVGMQLREEGCPSWFNATEIVQVTRYVKLLLNNKETGCHPSDIGVVTPYRKQVEKIRMMFKALHVNDVKIGSVEEFQGQERKVIILSTVRSYSNLNSTAEEGSLQSALGFLSNPKRFNVSVTRAQALMILIGDPFVLARDKYWKSLLQHCVNNGGYTGTDISKLLPSLQLCESGK